MPYPYLFWNKKDCIPSKMDLSIPFLPLFEGIQEKGWKGRFPKFVSFQKKKNHFETKKGLYLFKKSKQKKADLTKKKTFLKGGPRHKVCIFSKNGWQKKAFWNKKWFFFFEKIQTLHFLFQNGFFFLSSQPFFVSFQILFLKKYKKTLCRVPPFKKISKKNIYDL